jgi:hypothetical protein
MLKTGPRLIKRSLGRILVDAGLVAEERLDKALQEQLRTNKHLGEILVDMREILPADLDIVLSLQRDLVIPEQAVKLAAGVRKMLGELLVHAGRITPEQLEVALKEHKKTGEKIGQVLVRLGMATAKEIDTAVEIQTTMAAGPEQSTRLRLGELLVSARYITREQLADALVRQKKTKKKLGEILVEGGIVDAKAIVWGVRLQEMLVRAALIAALSLATMPAADVAEAGSVSTTMHISAVVLAHADLGIIKQPAEFVVTDADVRRGYVELNGASMIELKSNSRAGCLLSFSAHGLPFQETSINIMGRTVVLGPDGGLVTLPVLGRTTVELSYRFVLSPGTEPGTYAWPFTLSVSPLG